MEVDDAQALLAVCTDRGWICAKHIALPGLGDGPAIQDLVRPLLAQWGWGEAGCIIGACLRGGQSEHPIDASDRLERGALVVVVVAPHQRESAWLSTLAARISAMLSSVDLDDATLAAYDSPSDGWDPRIPEPNAFDIGRVESRAVMRVVPHSYRSCTRHEDGSTELRLTAEQAEDLAEFVRDPLYLDDIWTAAWHGQAEGTNELLLIADDDRIRTRADIPLDAVMFELARVSDINADLQYHKDVQRSIQNGVSRFTDPLSRDPGLFHAVQPAAIGAQRQRTKVVGIAYQMDEPTPLMRQASDKAVEWFSVRRPVLRICGCDRVDRVMAKRCLDQLYEVDQSFLAGVAVVGQETVDTWWSLVYDKTDPALPVGAVAMHPAASPPERSEQHRKYEHLDMAQGKATDTAVKCLLSYVAAWQNVTAVRRHEHGLAGDARCQLLLIDGDALVYCGACTLNSVREILAKRNLAWDAPGPDGHEIKLRTAALFEQASATRLNDPRVTRALADFLSQGVGA